MYLFHMQSEAFPTRHDFRTKHTRKGAVNSLHVLDKSRVFQEFPVATCACMRFVSVTFFVPFQLFRTGKLFVANFACKCFFRRMRILHVAPQMGRSLETFRTLFAIVWS